MIISAFLYFAVFFLYFQTFTIYGGDAGDLVTAAFTGGIAHPPGYPLYSFLGFIVTKLPLFTVAWRVSLLSSIPAALSLMLIVLILKRTKVPVVYGFIAALSLGVTHLYWLYAVVPEVFALHILLSLLLIFFTLEWYQKGNIRYLYMAAFVFGLATTHHHIIVFLVPACLFLLFKKRRVVFKFPRKVFIMLCGALLLGALPQIWIYISALSVPAVIWNDPVTLPNFIKLITRAQYGTFQSSLSYAQTIQSRLLQFPVMWEFYKNDFTLVGIVLAVMGNVYLFMKNRTLWLFYLIGFIFTGPLFLFYASYLVITSFTLATYERFLLPSYVFMTLWIGYGGYYFVEHLVRSKVSDRQVKNFFILLLLIAPIVLLYANYPRISILKHDKTAEKIAHDVLSTPMGKKSIILLQYDTIIFNTQYLYYTNKSAYPDVSPLHYQKLLTGDIKKQMKKFFPNIIVPPGKPISAEEFILDNYDSYEIFSTTDVKLAIPGSYWIPYGLLFRFYLQPDLPSYSEVVEANEKLWKMYQDPLAGSLGKYKNLMLANVLDFYRDAHIRTAGLYLNADDQENAKRHLREAVRVGNENMTAHLFLAENLIRTNDCKEAKRIIDSLGPIKNRLTKYFQVMYLYYTSCEPNESEATRWREKIDGSARPEEQAEELREL